MLPRARLHRILFALSGLIPLLGLLGTPPDTMLLIYSLFVALCFLPRPSLGGPVAFVAMAVLTGFAVEGLAWLGHYLKCSPEPALFHPQLLPDLAIGFGFYAGGGLAWAFLFRRFGFSLPQAFVIHGIFGVFIEQSGAAFLAGLAALPSGVLLWLYVFVVYGTMPGIARALADPGGPGKRDRRLWHWPAALALVAAGTILGTLAFAAILDAAGLIPPKRLICDTPFW